MSFWEKMETLWLRTAREMLLAKARNCRRRGERIQGEDYRALAFRQADRWERAAEVFKGDA